MFQRPCFAFILRKHPKDRSDRVTVFVRGEDIEKFPVVEGFLEYPLLLIAPRDDVVEGAFVFYPGLSDHSGRMADIQRKCQ